MITDRQSEVPCRMLWGPGGIGKSEIAIAFANQHLGDFSLIWSIASETEETYYQSYWSLAEWLGIFVDKEDSLTTIRFRVHRCLEGESFDKPWLLIFDNAEKELELPQRGKGAILITSRNRFGPSTNTIEVKNFDEAESLELFSKILGESPHNKELVQELEHFPLVVNQAAHYIEKTPGLQVEEYLTHLSQEKIPTLKDVSKDVRYPHTLASICQSTWDKLRQRSPDAVEWLEFCTFLSPDAIPLSWINVWLREIKKEKDHTQLFQRKNHILRTLVDYAVVGYHEEQEILSIHRLRQDIFKNQLERSKRKEKLLKVLSLLAILIKDTDPSEPRDWKFYQEWVPHASLMLTSLPFQVESEEVASIQTGLALWKKTRGDFDGVKERLESALDLRLKLYGKEHPKVADSLHNLGNITFHLGDYSKAKKFDEQALSLRQKLYGGEHTKVAESLYGLGVVLHHLENYKEAKEVFKQALNLFKKLYGEEHSLVAMSLGGLGETLLRLHKIQKAKEIQERALKLCIKLHGNDHPDTAYSLIQLGDVLICLGDDQEMKKCYEQALTIFKKCYGEEHPLVADSLYNSACAFDNLEHAKQALSLYQKFYGDKHPKIAFSLLILGHILIDEGELERGMQLYGKGVELLAQLYGENHPHVAKALRRLGYIADSLGSYSKAKVLIEHALNLCKKFDYSDNHDVVIDLRKLRERVQAARRCSIF